MRFGRFALSFMHRQSNSRVKNGFMFTQVRGKSLQNWKRPSMEEYLPPLEPYEDAMRKAAVRNYAQMGFGIGFFAFSLYVGFSTDQIRLPGEHNFKANFKYPAKKVAATAEKTEAVFPDAVTEIQSEIEQDIQEKDESETVPVDVNAIPEKVEYLLIGGGTASFAAYRSIKARDPRAKILIVSNENSYPYMRPPLSKELWYSKKKSVSESEFTFTSYSGRERNIFYEKGAFYMPPYQLENSAKGGISILKGASVVKLDSESQLATLSDGRHIKYEKCLIATGGSPKSLELFKDMSNVTTFRSLDSFFHLDELISTGKVKSIAVVGGGFLGTELACSMAILGKDKELAITQIFPEKGHLAKILPEYLSQWATKKIRKDGINVIDEAVIESAQQEDGQIKINTNKGSVLVDHVVVTVGIEPNTQLAKSAGLAVSEKDGGLSCNSRLETNKKNIFVAGDVASYFHPVADKTLRVEHHDNAIVTGKLAGENMTGGNKDMSAELMFWSDMGLDIGIEAIGQIDTTLETVGFYAKTDDAGDEFDRGVVFYMDKDEVVVGVLLWNIFNHMSIARKVVRENRKFEDLSDVARLFKMFGSPSQEPEEAAKDENAPEAGNVSEKNVAEQTEVN